MNKQTTLKNGTTITYQNPRPQWHYRFDLTEEQKEERRNFVTEVTTTIASRTRSVYTCANGYEFPASLIGDRVQVGG